MDSLTQTAIATDRIENLLPTDILILAINDDSIQDIAQVLGKIAPNSCVFHTSGSTSLEVLSEYLPHCGVLYPLQTFSKDRKVDFHLFLCLLRLQMGQHRNFCVVLR